MSREWSRESQREVKENVRYRFVLLDVVVVIVAVLLDLIYFRCALSLQS